MFGFHCLGKKPKIKEDTQSYSPEKDEVSEKVERKKFNSHMNSFPLESFNKNLFLQCFTGGRKYSEKSSESLDNGSFINDGDCGLKNNNRKECNLQELIPFGQVDFKKKTLAEKLFDLSKHGWYWGPLTQLEANEKLQGEIDGAFLVRDSSCNQYLLTLSFKSHQKTFHAHIDHVGSTFSLENGVYFDTLEELISHTMTHFWVLRRDPNDNDNVERVKLIRPISRFTQVRTLQYLCRFVIRQYVRADFRQKLPVPHPIMEYIEEAQF